MKIQSLAPAVVAILLVGCSSGSSDTPAPVNQAPTVSFVGETSITANNVSQPISFSVSDEQLDRLTISVSSDRQQLVPDSSLSVEGSGTDRSLTVTPTVDETGDAFVTIIATDEQGLSASTSFLLIVNAEQLSMYDFARETFAASEDDDPELINAVEFVQDADDDDFADLLAQ